MYRIHIVTFIRWNHVIYFSLFRVHQEITDLRSWENRENFVCIHTVVDEEWEFARICLNLLWSQRFWTSCLDGVFHPGLNWINRGNYLCPLAAINYKQRNVHSGTFAFHFHRGCHHYSRLNYFNHISFKSCAIFTVALYRFVSFFW